MRHDSLLLTDSATAAPPAPIAWPAAVAVGFNIILLVAWLVFRPRDPKPADTSDTDPTGLPPTG